MSLKIAFRLVLLAVIVLAGLSYITFGVLQLQVGAQPFDVTVALQRAGGLYVGSDVAYRGVDVGKVKALDLYPGGITAHLSISPGTRIPQASTAAVHDLSAVGEQYLNLTPTGAQDGGPWLRGGSRISAADVTVPTPVSTTLNDLSSFTTSVDTTRFSQLLSIANTALAGNGPALRSLLDNTERLFSEAESVEPQTASLIDNSQTLLQTAEQTNPDVASFAASLNGLTAQLDSSRSALAATLANGAAATAALNQFLTAHGQAITNLTQQSASVADVFSADGSAVRALLAVLPATAARLTPTVTNGEVNAKFFYNDAEPLCAYDGATQPVPAATAPIPLDLSHNCDATGPDLEQRGAATAPPPAP